MSLKTYVLTPAYSAIIKMVAKPRRLKSGRPKKPNRLYPGDAVRYYDGTGYGLVIAVLDEAVTVLWSDVPKPERFRATIPLPFPSQESLKKLIFFQNYNIFLQESYKNHPESM